MLGFGLSFIKNTHIKMKWYAKAQDTNGPNPQIAAHLDHDLRRIFASYVMQYLNSLDFGFQGIVKRFEFRVPSGTYININPDTGEETEEPIWSEGGVQPIAWKEFVALRPEGVEPVWDKSTGEFFGIEYSPAGSSTSGGGGAATSSGGSGGTNKEETFKIDIARALWVTNEKEQSFGSIFGYPRLAYSYPHWWSYWFRWAISDRAFERKADPSVIVYHPEGEFLNETTGERMSHSEYALLMGERMRSGGVIALPSEAYEDLNGRGVLRQWEIDFTKDSVNFQPFDDSFEYLDVQKLRSLFIPEQAFLEGKGGTSSRNVAESMEGSFHESQIALQQAILQSINRWVIPQWLAANYPEFTVNNGTAEIVAHGTGDEDRDFTLQLFQLLGQQQTGAEEIQKYTDIKALLENRGIPLLSFAQQQAKEAELIAARQAQQGPDVGGIAPPAGGTSEGIIPSPSGTGFTYTVPREDMITLATSGTAFIDDLPNTIHYTDTTVKGFTRMLWSQMRSIYRDEYETLARAFETAQEDADIQKIFDDWKGSKNWNEAYDRINDIMANVMVRGAKVEMARLRKEGKVSKSDAQGWLNSHLPEVMAKAQETCRAEAEIFLKNIRDEVEKPEEIAKAARKHFSDFPDWKSDRFVRTEIRDAYNTATLYAGTAAGFNQAQAIDGQGSNPIMADEDCRERHGKIYKIADALDEQDHPNGTLGWRMVPATLSIERSNEDGFFGADFNEEEEKLTLSSQLDDDAEKKILLRVIDTYYA